MELTRKPVYLATVLQWIAAHNSLKTVIDLFCANKLDAMC